MQKFFVPRTLFATALLGVVLLVIACGGDTPTSTPVPPTLIVPTALPPAPTAPPLTAVPTAVLPTATPPPPAATAVVPPTQAPTTAASPAPTNTTASSAPTNTTASSSGAATSVATRTTAVNPPTPSVDRGALNGLYVSNLRFDPTFPRTNDPLTFFATIINQTGKDQHYPVCVEIYRPGEAKPFGTSSCDTSTIVPNTSEVHAGYWTGTGFKECLPVRARPVLRQEGEGEGRLVFTTLSGAELWIDFNVCP